MRHLLFALLLSLTPAPVFALSGTEMFEDPAQETRAREIGRQLRCLKCRNQSIFDSNAGIAHDLRVVVRERMVAGDTDAEILAYVRDRFGDYVLMKPPVDSHTYVLWFAPIVLLLIGGLSVTLYVRSRAAPLATVLSDADRAEAQQLMKKEGS